jgi:6-phosphogluconolactonase (cycloisomerase 2 family)
MMSILRVLRLGWAAMLLATVAGTLYGQVLLYVPTETSNELWEYGIVSATGAPTNYPTQSVTGNQPNVVAVTPNNRFMYVGNGTGNIVGYVVNYDGTLTPIAPPFANGSGVRGLAIDSSGRYLYASNNTGNQIVMFRIDQTTGALDYANPVITSLAGAARPRGMVADNSGHLYVVLQGTSLVNAYAIQNDGTLTALSSVATGSTPDRVAIAYHSSGTYLYVTNFLGLSISVYNVLGSGAISLNTTVTTPASRPTGIIADNTSKFILVTLQTTVSTDNVLVYSIQNGGGLTLGSSQPSESSVVAGVSLPSGLATDPSNNYLYISNSGNNTVTKFRFNQSTGALSERLVFPTGTTPQFLLSRPAPTAPVTTAVPAASSWSLLGLGILLAGSSAFLYRRAYR